MYIIIVGAGKIGYNLTKALIAEGHEVLVIERDRNKYNLLVKELGEAIYFGNGCEFSTLKTVGTNRADMFIALTGLDQENLVACQLAKLLFMVPKTLAIVNEPKNEDIFKSLGVDLVVNTTNLISALIGHKLDIGILTPLLTFKNLEIVQAEITDSSPAANRAVKDLGLPADSLLIAAIRDGNAVLLKGDSIITANDTIVALTTKEKENELRKIL
ncbi:MAG: NAD-binding protein [candidate division WOR-3 bacterium]